MRPFVFKKQKGVSLIITFFVMVIILIVVLAITSLLYSELKVIKNIGNSVTGFYAADSGVEKVLFYDRQVLISGVSRGLCTMTQYDAQNNPQACLDASNNASSGLNPLLLCNNAPSPQLLDPINHPQGCDPNVCNDCKISFDTTDSNFSGWSYKVSAMVAPLDDQHTTLTIDAKGFYQDASRQIHITGSRVEPQDAIIINGICANPTSTAQGNTIDISADIQVTLPGDTISDVSATILDKQGNLVATITNSDFVCTGCSESGNTAGTFEYDWPTNSSTTAQDYFVNVDIKDSLGNEKISNNVQPCNP